MGWCGFPRGSRFRSDTDGFWQQSNDGLYKPRSAFSRVCKISAYQAQLSPRASSRLRSRGLNGGSGAQALVAELLKCAPGNSTMAEAAGSEVRSNLRRHGQGRYRRRCFPRRLTRFGRSWVGCGWLSESAQRWRSEKSWHGPCVHLSCSLQSNAWWQTMAG